MARLQRTPPLGAPAISLLLLLLAALASAAAAADPPAAKKPGMRMRYADKEEARWLDRYAETHQPLGAGPLRVQPATEEEAYWLNRMSDTTAGRAGDQSHDGEDGGGGGGNYIEFDEDNPYVHALQAWASRLIKQGMEKAQAEDNPFQDL